MLVRMEMTRELPCTSLAEMSTDIDEPSATEYQDENSQCDTNLDIRFSRLYRPALGDPFRQPAVQDRDFGVSKLGQRPPDARTRHHPVRVIDNNYKQ